MFWHNLKDKDEDVLFLYDDFQLDSTFIGGPGNDEKTILSVRMISARRFNPRIFWILELSQWSLNLNRLKIMKLQKS